MTNRTYLNVWWCHANTQVDHAFPHLPGDMDEDDPTPPATTSLCGVAFPDVPEAYDVNLRCSACEEALAQPKWIKQTDCTGGGCCYPIALCNALRYHGLPSPEPGTPDWERLIDVSLCRVGSALQRHNVRAWLGVVEVWDPTWQQSDGQLPILLHVNDPQYGYHVVLLVERREDEVRLINYGGERSTWITDIPLPPKEDNPVWVVPCWRAK